MIDREEIERLERHHEHLNIRHRVLVRFFFFPLTCHGYMVFL